MKVPALVCCIVLTALGTLTAPAAAAPTLTIVETPGDNYTVTAHDQADPGQGYWEIKIDSATGGIYSFKDLTDAGNGAGGHSNYLNVDAYNRAAPLFTFDGRGGNVFGTSGMLTDIADRLSYETGPNNAYFKITYTETAAATDFFHDVYAPDLAAGDLLTTITFTIRPPYQTGTFWDWSISCENVSDHAITDKAWAAEYLFVRLYQGVAKTADSDDSRVDGPWNPTAPKSFARWTVGANPTSGFTAGREFILDFQTTYETQDNGGTTSQGSWAGFDYQRVASPFDYDTALPAGDTRHATGQLIVTIIAPDGGLPGANVAPTADAGDDQTLTDTDRNSTELVDLDGSASTDSDGVITSYEWSEGATLLATGQTPTVTLGVGVHTIDLTVTDDDLDTGGDTVVITVNSPPAGTPIANAGSDLGLADVDDSGSEPVTLDGSASTDPDGALVSWIWRESGVEIATGPTPQVDLAVGTHTIDLTVTDNAGLSSTDSVTVTIYAPEPSVTYYLDAVNGDDANPGTSAEPWQTFDHAMSTADAGDIVFVRPGNYGDVVLNAGHNLGNPGGYITYRADPATCRQRPADWWDVPMPANWSDPADRAVLNFLRLDTTAGPSYLEFDGLDVVQNVSRIYSFVVGGKDNVSHLRLKNLNIFAWWGDSCRGIYFQQSAGATTDFHNILVDGCYVLDGSGGLTIGGLTKENIVFRNNHFYHTEGSALGLLDGVSEQPIIIEHNHIHFQDPIWHPEGGGGVGDYSHGSGISIRRENLVIRRNIIHNHGTSRAIYTYDDGTTSPGGYTNLLFENNLLYDTNNYPFELTEIGGNVVIRNNTIIGGNRDANSSPGMKYYVGFVAKYNPAATGDALQFYNNIVVGGVSDNGSAGNGPFWGDWHEGGNIIWSTPFEYVSEFAPDSTSQIISGWLETFDDNPLDYFEGSGNFFVGGDLFDQYSFTTVPMTANERIAHGQLLNYAYMLAAGSPAIGAADAAQLPATDLLGNPRNPAVPCVGAFDYVDSSPDLPGDANRDGTVDLKDFVALKTNFGSGTTWEQGDFDGDGDVDLNDFVILKTNFGASN